jgi:serine/threonine protein kinase
MTDVPFTDTELQSAFPEYAIDLPMLGAGGMKAAYLTSDSVGNAVLKIVLEPVVADADADPAELPVRFARELKAMADIESAHIVELLSPPERRDICGRTHLWYLEPYYSGGTLLNRLDGVPDVAGAVRLCRELLTAVRDLWEQGKIVHRDIKPGNIVFRSDGTSVLLDLGIALHMDLTQITNSWQASPRTDLYAAPEQFDFRRLAPIDFRTDLFLVGIVVFELLTGSHPFWRNGIASSEYMRRLASADLNEEAFAAAQAPEEFKDLLRRLLAPRPNRRYRSVTEPLNIALGVAQ